MTPYSIWMRLWNGKPEQVTVVPTSPEERRLSVLGALDSILKEEGHRLAQQLQKDRSRTLYSRKLMLSEFSICAADCERLLHEVYADFDIRLKALGAWPLESQAICFGEAVTFAVEAQLPLVPASPVQEVEE